ncbi:phenylalanine--tRNA ligase alpha subunit-like [Styela clava]
MTEKEVDMATELLQFLELNERVNSISYAKTKNLEHQKIVGLIKSLQVHEGVIDASQKTDKNWVLSTEGKKLESSGSYEFNIFKRVPADGIAQSELVKDKNDKIGFSKAMSNRWIKVDKSGGAPKIFVADGVNPTDIVRDNLSRIKQGSPIPDKDRAELKKRKLVEEVTIKSFDVTKGEKFTTKIEKAATDLTAQMIQDGSWKTTTFKDYNYSAMGIKPSAGHLHPLLKVRSVYRQIFLEMGFTEMPTNNYVESSFWNFDALFQPQQHPARDAHDTFFISDPAECDTFPADYAEKVKRVHSEGGFGSQGYCYDWKYSEAKKNLLRTHTTAVSARMLYKLAKEGFKPSKYFSIDRVFRNESLDATHLAEFHQVEGVVADYSVTLGDLMGVLQAFFHKLGITKLRFKPAYNPYTEPSMEIFSYHEGLKKWVEVGNSGIFRPEMLLPMGLPEDVNVIAWGLSLERPTMIKYGIDNIRDLVGHKINLQMVQDNPVCRMDF